MASHNRARPGGRFRLFPVVVGVVVANVAAFSGPAHADDPPPEPSIVVGGTVHPSATIVVDPQKPPPTTAGPIDASKPIGVDPRVGPPPGPWCCNRSELIWHPKNVPPVVQVERREVDQFRSAYLDNHGRYWLQDRFRGIVEQVGGWPQPPPKPGSATPPNSTTFFDH
jgi:hypothetical protein